MSGNCPSPSPNLARAETLAPGKQFVRRQRRRTLSRLAWEHSLRWHDRRGARPERGSYVSLAGNSHDRSDSEQLQLLLAHLIGRIDRLRLAEVGDSFGLSTQC